MTTSPDPEMLAAVRAAVTRYLGTVCDPATDADADEPDTWWHIGEMAIASVEEDALTRWGAARPDTVAAACDDFLAATGSAIVDPIDRAGQAWIVAATAIVADQLPAALAEVTR